MQSQDTVPGPRIILVLQTPLAESVLDVFLKDTQRNLEKKFEFPSDKPTESLRRCSRGGGEPQLEFQEIKSTPKMGFQ